MGEYLAGTLSHVLVKNYFFGIVAVVLTVVGCVVFPPGGAVMVFLLTIVQYVSVLLNLTVYKEKNIRRVQATKATLKDNPKVRIKRKG